jgi:HAD superfamily hydrolase (TIGR01549 family)
VAGPVEAVLLDMDDTIFDHSLTCRAAISSLRPRYPFLRRRPLDDVWHDYTRLLGNDSALVGSYVGRPGHTVDELRRHRWRRVALNCGAALGPEEVVDLSQAYRKSYQQMRRAVPGSRDLLRDLRGRVRVVVVTNNEVAEQEEKVRFLGIGPLIDGLVVSEAVGAAKPDRRIFEAALAAADAPPERAVMLGDSWGSDIVGALGVGVRPVWFNRFSLPRPGPPLVEELRALRPRRAVEATLLTGRAPALTDLAGAPSRASGL